MGSTLAIEVDYIEPELLQDYEAADARNQHEELRRTLKGLRCFVVDADREVLDQLLEEAAVAQVRQKVRRLDDQTVIFRLWTDDTVRLLGDDLSDETMQDQVCFEGATVQRIRNNGRWVITILDASQRCVSLTLIAKGVWKCTYKRLSPPSGKSAGHRGTKYKPRDE